MAGIMPREGLSTLLGSFRSTGPSGRRRLASLSTGIAFLSLGAVVTAVYVSRLAEGGHL